MTPHDPTKTRGGHQRQREGLYVFFLIFITTTKQLSLRRPPETECKTTPSTWHSTELETRPKQQHIVVWPCKFSSFLF